MEEDAWALESRSAHAALLANQWWNRTWKPRIKAAETNEERAEIREEALKDKTERILSGELAFSGNDILRQELDALLRVIEWDKRRWKPIPDGVASRGGRRWGSKGAKNKAGEGEVFDSDVHVDVSDPVGELIRRGCYWTSLDATENLRRWYDRHGRGPAHAADLPLAVRGLYLMVCALGAPSADQMEQRDGWRAAVLTPGDILRRAIVRAGVGYEPQGRREEEDG